MAAKPTPVKTGEKLHQCAVRVTRQENSLIGQAAAKADMTKGAFIAQAALKEARLVVDGK